MVVQELLPKIYTLLDQYFGDLHWWPAESAFEMMVGAILTQNTTWVNAEKAIKALRNEGFLTPEAIFWTADDELAKAILPAGYYRVKTARLKAFVGFFLTTYSGNVATMAAEALPGLRRRLLSVKGIGPETADCIMLYACQKPVFVCDAYTRRMFLRHNLVDEAARYDDIQALVMSTLPQKKEIYKQFHALIVETSKRFCLKQPKCAVCPLAVLDPEEVT